MQMKMTAGWLLGAIAHFPAHEPIDGIVRDDGSIASAAEVRIWLRTLPPEFVLNADHHGMPND